LSYAIAHTPVSFSHGDFSIDNIMSTHAEDSIALIDPISDPSLCSSWLIDMAKLYTSIEFNHGHDDCRLNLILEFVKNKDIKSDIITSHAIGHLCRLIPYDKSSTALSQLKNKLNVLRQKVNSKES
jgi:hypothetical protein